MAAASLTGLGDRENYVYGESDEIEKSEAAQLPEGV